MRILLVVLCVLFVFQSIEPLEYSRLIRFFRALAFIIINFGMESAWVLFWLQIVFQVITFFCNFFSELILLA